MSYYELLQTKTANPSNRPQHDQNNGYPGVIDHGHNLINDQSSSAESDAI